MIGQESIAEFLKTVKLAVAIPTLPLVDVRWALSVPRVLGQCPQGTAYFAEWRYGVGETREALYFEILNQVKDCTHILYWDSDVIPPDGAVLRLLMDDKEIVSALYFNSLYTGVAAWKDEKPVTVPRPDEVRLLTDMTAMQEVDKVGMGFTIMKRQVFDELMQFEEPPFFYYKIDVRNAKLLSEDFYAFEKLKKYGIKPWVDKRVWCDHLKALNVHANGTIG